MYNNIEVNVRIFYFFNNAVKRQSLMSTSDSIFLVTLYFSCLILYKHVNICLFSFCKFSKKNFSSKVYNLHCTDDGEPGEQTHSASDSREHVHKLGRSVLGDSVKCRCVKVNPNKLQLWIPFVF